MNDELAALRRDLIHGMQLSMQGSYQRRAPAAQSVPYLIEVRGRLRKYARDNPVEAEAWRLLSQADECMLDYAAAIHHLERAMALMPKKDKPDLKRLAMLQSSYAGWAELHLTSTELNELGHYLVAHDRLDPEDRTMKHTIQWLMDHGRDDYSLVVDGLHNRGAFSDFQVLHNVVFG